MRLEESRPFRATKRFTWLTGTAVLYQIYIVLNLQILHNALLFFYAAVLHLELFNKFIVHISTPKLVAQLLKKKFHYEGSIININCYAIQSLNFCVAIASAQSHSIIIVNSHFPLFCTVGHFPFIFGLPVPGILRIIHHNRAP